MAVKTLKVTFQSELLKSDYLVISMSSLSLIMFCLIASMLLCYLIQYLLFMFCPSVL